MANEPKKGIKDFLQEDIADQFKISGDDFAEALEKMVSMGNQVNKTFGQARARITELQTAVVDATPGVNKLGGSIEQVSQAIQEIALASRRNVVANAEDIEKLYASAKVLKTTVGELAESFQNVGVGISEIGPELEKSVKYIQNIGGNVEQVMKSVQANMEQMNRYQFEGGVQGLTKMAAQASMLRFSMSETFQLAEKVLTPEGAIETAAAFQRLGVSAGALADPFQLMNQSINDPQGLQDGLVNVAKQFAEFDEKTKTFKINPQGVLTLREMQTQTGVSAKEMSKMALAAAELDKRLSDVNRAGLKFASEDDKQYLANIAKMGESGKYEVELKDGTKKDLANLNQDEFDELIKAQKDQPKTMEDIARAQMGVSEIIKGDVSAIRTALLGGLVSARPIQQTVEGVRRGATTLSSAAANQLDSPKAVRTEVETGFKDVNQLIKDMQNKNIKFTDALSSYFSRLGKQTEGIEAKFKGALLKALEDAQKNTTNQTGVERLLKSGYGKVLNAAGVQQNQNASITSLIEGNKSTQQIQNEVKSIANQGGSQVKSQVDFGGGIKIDVNFNGTDINLTPQQKEQFTKMFVEKMNSTDMKNYILNINAPNNPTKAPTGKTLSP